MRIQKKINKKKRKKRNDWLMKPLLSLYNLYWSGPWFRFTSSRLSSELWAPCMWQCVKYSRKACKWKDTSKRQKKKVFYLLFFQLKERVILKRPGNISILESYYYILFKSMFNLLLCKIRFWLELYYLVIIKRIVLLISSTLKYHWFF
jgi:hypothetical protein